MALRIRAVRIAESPMKELPYLAHGPLGESFAEQTQDFCFLYDRGTTAAWVGSRWSIGDPEDLLLKRAVGSYLNGLFFEYPPPKPGSKSDYRKALLRPLAAWRAGQSSLGSAHGNIASDGPRRPRYEAGSCSPGP